MLPDLTKVIYQPNSLPLGAVIRLISASPGTFCTPSSPLHLPPALMEKEMEGGRLELLSSLGGPHGWVDLAPILGLRPPAPSPFHVLLAPQPLT